MNSGRGRASRERPLEKVSEKSHHEIPARGDGPSPDSAGFLLYQEESIVSKHPSGKRGLGGVSFPPKEKKALWRIESRPGAGHAWKIQS